MFELEKIKGSTFEDKSVILIDIGLSGEPAEELIETLIEYKLDVKYIINTHEH